LIPSPERLASVAGVEAADFFEIGVVAGVLGLLAGELRGAARSASAAIALYLASWWVTAFAVIS